MNWRRRLLWIDGFAALTAGIIMLLLRGFLSAWYELPLGFVTFLGIVNLVFAPYSLSLARRTSRPLSFIRFLVIANASWALLCFGLAVYWSSTASIFGLAHLIGEGLFVGGLAYLEWKYRSLLASTPTNPLP